MKTAGGFVDRQRKGVALARSPIIEKNEKKNVCVISGSYKFHKVEALVSRHPRDAKKVSVNIQSLYGSRKKTGFLKVAVSTAVRLRFWSVH